MAKRIETQLSIKAVDRYSNVLKNMHSVTGRFADGVRTEMGRLQEMRGPLRLIEDFRKTQNEAQESARALEAARKKLRDLQRDLIAVERPTEEMRREFQAARREVTRLERAVDRNGAALNNSRSALRDAGIDTGRLAGEQRRLTRALDSATPAFDRQMQRMQRMEAMQTRIAAGRERMERSLATAANLSFAGGASMQTGRRILTGTTGVANRSGDLEEKFTDFQNLTGIDDTRVTQLRGELEGLRDVTKSSVAEMLDGLGVLVGKGMDFEDALAALPATGRAAKATKTQFDEMGASGFALFDNLKVAPEELSKAFDIMAMGGKEGGFELSAMARKFPEITAGARSLKMEGLDSVAQLTAALQVAMKSAGSEDQAATNLSNFLGKLTSPETVRNFEKFGISVERELQKAADRGVSPMEHMLQVIDEVTGGDAIKMGQLFGDKQVLDFLRAMIPNMEEYRRIKEASLSADGVVDEDLAKIMETFNESKKQLGESIGNLFTLPPEVLESLTNLFKWADATIEKMILWKKEHPKLTKYLFLGATAVGAMAVAGGALLTAGAGLIGTLAVLRFGLVGFSARAAFAAGDLLSIGGAFRGLTRLPRFALSGLITGFSPALAQFTGFRRDASAEITKLSTHVEKQSAIMQRSLSGLRWGAFSAGIMTFLAMRNLPEDPEKQRQFREQNDRTMDRAFRSVPGISHLMEGYEKTFEWVYGKPPPTAPALLPDNPAIRTAADTVYRAAGNNELPTPERIARLREEVAAYRAEAEAAKIALEAMPELNSMGVFNSTRFDRQAELDSANATLKRTESQLASAEAGADELTDALKVIHGTEVAPEINTESIDQAVEKIIELTARMEVLPYTGTGPRPVPKPAGARAMGGPVRSGYPYLVNENTPRSEWFVPSQSGGVLNVSQAQAAFRSYLSTTGPQATPRIPALSAMNRSAERIRKAGLAALSVTAIALPAAAAAPGGKSASNDVRVEINGGINIQVPSGVSDPEAIADLVSDRIGQRVAATMSASFSD